MGRQTHVVEDTVGRKEERREEEREEKKEDKRLVMREGRVRCWGDSVGGRENHEGHERGITGIIVKRRD